MNIFKNNTIIQSVLLALKYLHSYRRIGHMFQEVNGLFYVVALLLTGKRLFKIASLFLPIKVIIVMSQDELPRYFNKITEYMERNEFILLLALSIPVSYILYIVFGIFYNILLNEDKIKQSDKFVNLLGKSWNEATFQKFHRNITESISEIFTILISFILVLIFDLLFLILFIISTAIIYILFFKYIYAMKSSDRVTMLKLDRGLILEYVTSLSFLFIFFIVFIRLYYSDLDVLGAIYIIMLARICFLSLERFSRKGIQIHRNISGFIKEIGRL